MCVNKQLTKQHTKFLTFRCLWGEPGLQQPEWLKIQLKDEKFPLPNSPMYYKLKCSSRSTICYLDLSLFITYKYFDRQKIIIARARGMHAHAICPSHVLSCPRNTRETLFARVKKKTKKKHGYIYKIYGYFEGI